MKVRELIEKLMEMDRDAEVHFAYDYGDRHHTLVAPMVKNVEEYAVRHSGYFNMDVLVDDGENEAVSVMAVVLQS